MSIALYERRRQGKKQLLEYLSTEIPKHRGFIVVGITGVDTPTLQSARKALKGRAVFRVTKNTILSKALDKIDLPVDIKNRIKDSLTSENALVFSDDSVFSVAAELSKFKRPAYIKPNRTTPVDVVIPEGVTPLQPGPLTDSLNALGIPFEVKKNLVYIKKDSLVVKKGERVNARVAELLRALDIAPLTSSFELKLAVEDGLYIAGDKLSIDLAKLIGDVSSAHSAALTITVNLGIPVPGVMPLILAKAAKEALTLGVECGYVSAETLPYLISRGVAAAQALNKLVEK